jgi:hypothetical protein
MRRITRRDRIRLAVPVPKLQTRLESDGKRRSCEFPNDSFTPHFRHFREQIPQKESARDKNLRTPNSSQSIIYSARVGRSRDIRPPATLSRVLLSERRTCRFLPTHAGRSGRVVPTLATFCERGGGLPRVVVQVDLRTIAYSTRFFGLERTSTKGRGVE